MVLCLVFCVAQGPEELAGVRLYPATFSCASPMVLSPVEKNILVTELGQLLLCLPHEVLVALFSPWFYQKAMEILCPMPISSAQDWPAGGGCVPCLSLAEREWAA